MMKNCKEKQKKIQLKPEKNTKLNTEVFMANYKICV